MPGCHVNDYQVRKLMKLKQTHSIEKAAVKSGFSRTTGYRINQDARLPSQKTIVARGRRRPDPLAGIFDEQVMPMLENCPNLHAVSMYAELMRRNPELDTGVRRTLERRIRAWRAQYGAEQEVIFRLRQEPRRMDCRMRCKIWTMCRTKTVPLKVRMNISNVRLKMHLYYAHRKISRLWMDIGISSPK